MNLRLLWCGVLAIVPWTAEAFPPRTAFVSRDSFDGLGKIATTGARAKSISTPLRGGSSSGGDYQAIDSSVFQNTTLVEEDDEEAQAKLEVLFSEFDTKRHYNWREFFPRPARVAMGPLTAEDSLLKEKIVKPRLLERQIKVVRWFVTGNSQHKPSESKKSAQFATLGAHADFATRI